MEVAQEWFRHACPPEDEGLVRIVEPFYADRANLWLVPLPPSCGPGKVLVDAGTGANDLHQYLLDSHLLAADEPLFVVLTHAHNDHAGGARHFYHKPNCTLCIHRSEAEILEKGLDEVQWANRPNMWRRKPYPDFSAATFQALQAGVKADRLFTGKGKEFVVADFLQVLHFPGHSPGSIVLLDNAKRRLFCGDLVYSIGLTIDTFPSSDRKECIKSLKRLKKLRSSFDMAYAGHGVPMHVEQVMDACDAYIMVASKQKPK